MATAEAISDGDHCSLSSCFTTSEVSKPMREVGPVDRSGWTRGCQYISPETERNYHSAQAVILPFDVPMNA